MRSQPQPRRGDLVRSLTRQVQDLHGAAERTAQVFAERHALHPTDLRALTAVYRAELTGRPLTASALAADLHLTPAAVTYAVGRLCDSGHLRRESDPEDGRRMLLRYSQAGLDVAADFFGPLAAVEASRLAGFTEEELVSAHRVMEALIGGLSEHEERLRET